MSTDNDTTYCIYRIVNFVNSKCYIGQTIDHNRRSYEHFASLKRQDHHSRKLQYAFNKYGRQSFYVEVLESDIPSIKSTEREKYWIEYYDSFNEGYNCHEGGNLGGEGAKPIFWNGIQHKSINAAARALGITGGSMGERLAKGYTCDDDMRWKKQITYNGILYTSIKNAALANGISPVAMYDRVSKGYTCDADMEHEHQKECIWNGVIYQSISEAAKANRVSKGLMYFRIKKGYTNDLDVPVYPKPCVWNGVSYNSQREAAIANGILEGVMTRYLKRGFTCDADLPEPNNSMKPCAYNGMEYESVAEAAKANGLSRAGMRRKLKKQTR